MAYGGDCGLIVKQIVETIVKRAEETIGSLYLKPSKLVRISKLDKNKWYMALKVLRTLERMRLAKRVDRFYVVESNSSDLIRVVASSIVERVCKNSEVGRNVVGGKVGKELL